MNEWSYIVLVILAILVILGWTHANIMRRQRNSLINEYNEKQKSTNIQYINLTRQIADFDSAFKSERELQNQKIAEIKETLNTHSYQKELFEEHLKLLESQVNGLHNSIGSINGKLDLTMNGIQQLSKEYSEIYSTLLRTLAQNK